MSNLASEKQWRQDLHDKRIIQVDDDDASTAVPSDVLDGTVSDLSTWDTGNLEELGSCGVLSSAEMRAARLQKIARASAAQATASSSRPKAKAKSVPLQPARPTSLVTPASSASKPVHGYPSPCGHQDQVSDDQTTATPSEIGSVSEDLETSSMSSAELRAARLSSSTKVLQKPQTEAGKAKAPASLGVKPKATSGLQVPPKAKALHQVVCKGSQLESELNKSSREAIRDMGLWEYMPARNPVVTRQSAKGADWHVGFEEYEHSLGGVPDAKPVERPHKADDMMRKLDAQSRDAIKEMGLWEHMPARNPVVTRQTVKGADWHIGFEEYQHSLGGVPDCKPVERPPQADQLHQRLDVQSRKAVKEMGLWEHMPARNPVVTQQSNKGNAWHISFD